MTTERNWSLVQGGVDSTEHFDAALVFIIVGLRGFAPCGSCALGLRPLKVVRSWPSVPSGTSQMPLV